MDWTYCKDEMPSIPRDLLLCTNEGDEQFVYEGYYLNGRWIADDGTELIFDPGTVVYAWAYLPDPAPLPEVVT